MAITEFAVLETIPPHTAESPRVRTFLAKVAERQAAWSGHPLLFFQDTDAPATVYLVSGWADVPAHHAWIASEANQALLREAGSLMTVKSFQHLAIDFETMPEGVSHLAWEVRPRGEQASGGDRASASVSVSIGATQARPEAVWEREGPVLEREDRAVHRLRGFCAGSGGLLDGNHRAAGDNAMKDPIVLMRRMLVAE